MSLTTPMLYSEVAGGVTPTIVCLFREPDAGNPPVRFDERVVSRRREIVVLYEKMKEGPSKPPCRRRLQTAISCFGAKTAVVNVMVKRRGERSRHVWIRETSVSHPLAKASKSNSDEHQKPELPACSGNSMEVTYLLAMRCSGA